MERSRAAGRGEKADRALVKFYYIDVNPARARIFRPQCIEIFKKKISYYAVYGPLSSFLNVMFSALQKSNLVIVYYMPKQGQLISDV